MKKNASSYRTDDTIRSRIDDMLWLVSLGSREGAREALDLLQNVRDAYGNDSGWWGPTFNRIELQAMEILTRK